MTIIVSSFPSDHPIGNEHVGQKVDVHLHGNVVGTAEIVQNEEGGFELHAEIYDQYQDILTQSRMDIATGFYRNNETGRISLSDVSYMPSPAHPDSVSMGLVFRETGKKSDEKPKEKATRFERLEIDPL